MQIRIFERKQELGEAAAAQAAAAIGRAAAAQGRARILAATGASQFEFLAALTRRTDIDWQSVELFHLDEYIGITADHPASFQRYLLERLIRPTGISRCHLLDGSADPEEVRRRVGSEIRAAPIDCAFVGIGENGHLAFNDPPADYETDEPYLIVRLDEACRRQQVGEGWFRTVDDVPARAITISIRQLLESREIIAIVPDERKAHAVQACLEGPIRPEAPASILQTHPNTTVYLDTASAALLSRRPPIRA
ncbi:MAG TPA: glucosamine-6-phosphate deaminase [Vicinamibacterales bacterium]|nr:glucosamine-6-phosphate deaminase [Vicinamibacterales bacterium]